MLNALPFATVISKRLRQGAALTPANAEIEAADRTCYLTVSQYTNTKAASPDQLWSITFGVCWLLALHPNNMRVYLRDGSAHTIVRAATLR